MHVSSQPVTAPRPFEFDPELVRRMTRPGPCYSWYPTPERFSDAFTYRDYLQAVASLRTRGSVKPLALYVHIPLGDAGSEHAVPKSRDKAAVYLSYLKREIEMQGRLFAGMNRIEQLHFGGARAACLSDAQMAELTLHLRRSFQFAPDEAGEYAITVDARTVSRERVPSLRSQGFNHLTIGVQDAGHDLAGLVGAAREARFRTVGIDLACGAPGQDMASTAQALASVLAAAPDRVTVRDYAGGPHRQRRGVDGAPHARTGLALFGLCFQTLHAAGYVYIGMDHFARPGDHLAVAQAQGRLHRNCQGYSTHADMDLVACGASAIGAVAGTYSQNVKTLDAYYDLIERNELPIERGIRLDMDDALRRTVIQMLMCQFELSIPAIEQAYPIAFAEYFAAELEQLRVLAADGLVTLEAEWLNVTARGRVLIGNVCMVFDRYLRAGAAPRHARTI